MTAKRIQRKRTAGWRMPPGAVYVGRPSKWGNPWSPANALRVTMKRGIVGHDPVESSRPLTLAECVATYRESIDAREFGYGRAEIQAALRGKDLACWCALDAPCHADVLLEIANEGTKPHG